MLESRRVRNRIGFWLVWLGISCNVIPSHSAFGQSVQLPQVRSFGVGTTVSVPDRGSATLGGVGRLREGGFDGGPFSGSPSGRGRETTRSSVSTSVQITSLQEMDEQILAEARKKVAPTIPGDRSLKLQHSEESRMAEAERLAREAEARGRLKLAELHWKAAAERGSSKSKERLESPGTNQQSREIGKTGGISPVFAGRLPASR